MCHLARIGWSGTKTSRGFSDLQLHHLFFFFFFFLSQLYFPPELCSLAQKNKKKTFEKPELEVSQWLLKKGNKEENAL